MALTWSGSFELAEMARADHVAEREAGNERTRTHDVGAGR